MKIGIKIVLCLLAIVIIASCEKKKEIIKYPDYIYYGTNILSFEDGTALNCQDTYGMGATLGKKAKLKVVMTNLSTHTNSLQPAPIWFYSNNTGWVVTDYNFTDNVQTFTAIQLEKIDFGIEFHCGGGQGACKMEIYENSDKITKTKYFTW